MFGFLGIDAYYKISRLEMTLYYDYESKITRDNFIIGQMCISKNW